VSDPAGQIQIRIDVSGVSIASSRPVTASRVFVGRTAEETARLLPALFSICAVAQSAACAAALERAAGGRADSEVARLRRRLVDAETLREHLWRVLLDWPRALGEAPDMASMARVVAAFGALKTALAGAVDPLVPGASRPRPDEDAAHKATAGLAAIVADRVLGLGAAAWLRDITDLESLARWAQDTDTIAARLFARLLADGSAGLGGVPVSPLPALSGADLEARLGAADADRFVAEPSWDGRPAETSPLTRGGDLPLLRDLLERQGAGLLTRLAAQLAELARLAAGSAAIAEAAGPVHLDGGELEAGVGLAQVPAARGLLVHRVRIAGERVADYRILAPTEWNFHPAGAVALGLGDLARRAEPGRLAALANLYITAIDPCVSFSLEIDGPEPSH
jgi:hypothetical protein